MAIRSTRAVRAVAFLALAAAGAAFAGCASSKPPRPPFPVDDDPCASYCLVWVPPVYRDVPRLCPTSPAKSTWKTVCVERTNYREVEKPGSYAQRTIPDECRAYGIVQIAPAREEWVCVKCRDECTGCADDCWKKIRIPPQYDWCEKHETKEGWSYCAFTPPERGIVAETELCPEKRCEYVPPQYGIVYEKQLYAPGHWVWQKRYCPEPEPPCPKAVCAPCDSCKQPSSPTVQCCPPVGSAAPCR